MKTASAPKNGDIRTISCEHCDEGMQYKQVDVDFFKPVRECPECGGTGEVEQVYENPDWEDGPAPDGFGEWINKTE